MPRQYSVTNQYGGQFRSKNSLIIVPAGFRTLLIKEITTGKMGQKLTSPEKSIILDPADLRCRVLRGLDHNDTLILGSQDVGPGACVSLLPLCLLSSQ